MRKCVGPRHAARRGSARSALPNCLALPGHLRSSASQAASCRATATARCATVTAEHVLREIERPRPKSCNGSSGEIGKATVATIKAHRRDGGSGRRRLRTHPGRVAEWGGILCRGPAMARQILRKILRGNRNRLPQTAALRSAPGGGGWTLRRNRLWEFGGAPGVIRTPGTQFRKLLLYPPELRGHGTDAESRSLYRADGRWPRACST